MPVNRIVLSVPHSIPASDDDMFHPYDVVTLEVGERVKDILREMDVQVKLVASRHGRNVRDENRPEGRNGSYRDKIIKLMDKYSLLVDLHSYPDNMGDYKGSDFEIFDFGNNQSVINYIKDELGKFGWSVFLVDSPYRTKHSDIINNLSELKYKGVLIELNEKNRPEEIAQALATALVNMIRLDNPVKDPEGLQKATGTHNEFNEKMSNKKIKRKIYHLRERITKLHSKLYKPVPIKHKPVLNRSKEILMQIGRIESKLDKYYFKEKIKPRDKQRMGSLQNKLNRLYEHLHREQFIEPFEKPYFTGKELTEISLFENLPSKFRLYTYGSVEHLQNIPYYEGLKEIAYYVNPNNGMFVCLDKLLNGKWLIQILKQDDNGEKFTLGPDKISRLRKKEYKDEDEAIKMAEALLSRINDMPRVEADKLLIEEIVPVGAQANDTIEKDYPQGYGPGNRLESVKDLQPALDIIKRIAKKNNIKAWVVGGFPRDLVMSNPIDENTDLDVTTEKEGDSILLPQLIQEEEKLPMPEISQTMGLSTMSLNGTKIEFRGLRLGHAWVVPELAKLNIEPTQANIDTYSRDLTINTLVYDIETGEIIDNTERGLNDIKAKELNTPLPADVLLKHNPIIMIRTVRFAAQLGFKISSQLDKAIKDNVALLKTVRADRIPHHKAKAFRYEGAEELYKKYKLDQNEPKLSEAVKGEDLENGEWVILTNGKNAKVNSVHGDMVSVRIEGKSIDEYVPLRRIKTKWLEQHHVGSGDEHYIYGKDPKTGARVSVPVQDMDVNQAGILKVAGLEPWHQEQGDDHRPADLPLPPVHTEPVPWEPDLCGDEPMRPKHIEPSCKIGGICELGKRIGKMYTSLGLRESGNSDNIGNVYENEPDAVPGIYDGKDIGPMAVIPDDKSNRMRQEAFKVGDNVYFFAMGTAGGEEDEPEPEGMFGKIISISGNNATVKGEDGKTRSVKVSKLIKEGFKEQGLRGRGIPTEQELNDALEIAGNDFNKLLGLLMNKGYSGTGIRAAMQQYKEQDGELGMHFKTREKEGYIEYGDPFFAAQAARVLKNNKVKIMRDGNRIYVDKGEEKRVRDIFKKLGFHTPIFVEKQNLKKEKVETIRGMVERFNPEIPRAKRNTMVKKQLIGVLKANSRSDKLQLREYGIDGWKKRLDIIHYDLTKAKNINPSGNPGSPGRPKLWVRGEGITNFNEIKTIINKAVPKENDTISQLIHAGHSAGRLSTDEKNKLIAMLEQKFLNKEQALPIYQIKGKGFFFRDDKLGEYRNVKNPSDRIPIDQVPLGDLVKQKEHSSNQPEPSHKPMGAYSISTRIKNLYNKVIVTGPQHGPMTDDAERQTR